MIRIHEIFILHSKKKVVKKLIVIEGRVIDTCDELVDVDILNNYSWSEFEVLQEPNKDTIVDFQQKIG